MKEFSTYEKRILNELLRVDETPGGLTVLGNIIDFELYPNFFIELKSETDCPVRIAKTYLDQVSENYGSSGFGEMIKQLNNKMLFVVKLFQYLEREGEIYLTGDIPVETLGTKFDVSETPVGYNLEDKETIKLIYHFSRKKIVLVDSLRRFIKNDFKTDAEIKADKEQKSTSRKLNWTAFGVIITLCGLIFTSTMEVIKMNKKDPTKIDIVNDKFKVKMENDTLKINVEIDKFNDTLSIDSVKLINDKK